MPLKRPFGFSIARFVGALFEASGILSLPIFWPPHLCCDVGEHSRWLHLLQLSNGRGWAHFYSKVFATNPFGAMPSKVEQKKGPFVAAAIWVQISKATLEKGEIVA